ncbi:hypothetical protein [Absidia glauca]|uniref:Uncharacterized protein n=1 Tax=Absidia glauca TaxID=4829 RepID=A0A163J5F5_ABSGL|nr:hypothetical protein [Absidia glauca]
MNSSTHAEIVNSLTDLTDDQMTSIFVDCFKKGGKLLAQRMDTRLREAATIVFKKKRQAEPVSEEAEPVSEEAEPVEAVVVSKKAVVAPTRSQATTEKSISKRTKVITNGAEARFVEFVQFAGKWKYTVPAEYPENAEVTPMLVDKIIRDPSLDYEAGVQQMIRSMNQWEKLGDCCHGRVIAHRISLALLSSEYPLGVMQFGKDFGIRESSLKFFRVGAKRMARLALEVSPGLWSCPEVIRAWDPLCRVISAVLMHKDVFDKHLETLRNSVVLDRLEKESARAHLDNIRKYAKASLKILPKD